MSDSSRRIWASRIGLIAITALVGLSIAWQILSLLMLYDDEGYVLHSLNEFARNGALYDQVFSQYGPLYYLVAGGAARWIGFEWTHDLSRVITGIAWLATALAGGVLTTRLSDSRSAGVIGFVATSAHLGQMAHEPMHPGNLLAPLIAWGAVGSTILWEKNRPREFMLSVAALAAACALIKINVGVFIAGAGGMWWWCNHASPKWQRGYSGPVVMAAAVLIPLLLMKRHLDTDWGISFAVLSMVAIGTVGFLTKRTPNACLTSSHLALAIGTGLTIVAVACGAIMAMGTSWGALWQGVVIRPIQHADIYSFPPHWPAGTVTLTILSLGALIAICRVTQKTSLAIGAVRIGLALAFIVWTFALPAKTVGGVMVVFAGSMGWLLVSPTEPGSLKHQARMWVSLILVWQFLHAYPVAGTQLTWGTFLWIPLLVSAVTESLRELFNAARHRAWAQRAITVGVIIAGAILVGNPLRAGYYYYTHAVPLNLPGAQLLRVPPYISSSLRIMTANATLHGNTLFSLPGTFSFNLWSQLPTPTSQNVTHWFSLLDAKSQNEIIAQLEESGRGAWIVQPELLASIKSDLSSETTPLLDYWKKNYESVLKLDNYELHLPRGQAAVMINTANYYRAIGGPTDDPGMIEVSLVCPPHTQISHVEIHSFKIDTTRHDPDENWHAGNTSVESRSIYPQGISVDGEGFHPIPWPLTLEGLHQLRFYPTAPRTQGPQSRWWLKFVDSEDQVIAEARFDMRELEQPER